MNKKRIILFAFLVTVLTAPSSPLMLKLSLDELVRNAELITSGKVIERECKWGESGKWIYTYVTISVDEHIKGSGDKEVIVRHMGGEVGKKGLLVGNMPSFREGEEVLVFLRGMGPLETSGKEETSRVYEVSGLAQGKYGISLDETGRRIVRNDFSDLFIQDTSEIRTVDDEVLPKRPLSEFVSEIKEILEECEE